MAKKFKKKLVGKELSSWKKEKLGQFIAGMIMTIIFSLVLIAIILPIKSAFDDKKENQKRQTNNIQLIYRDSIISKIKTTEYEVYYE